jgi:hypothetical protein
MIHGLDHDFCRLKFLGRSFANLPQFGGQAVGFSASGFFIRHLSADCGFPVFGGDGNPAVHQKHFHQLHGG